MQHNNMTTNFDDILSLIKTARERIVKTVNTEIIDLYWQIGKEVSENTNNGGWGKSVVEELANYIASQFGGMRGFSAQNIWRMKQFYETYSGKPILSTLLRELSWSNNLLIMSRTKNDEEKHFYLKLAIEEKYSYRELDRQITAMRYERASISASRTKKLPVKSVIREQFIDSYVLDFLNLPEKHPEETLQKAIIANMKNFLLEIGKDFTFVGEEFRIQVGKTDFYIDLLFYHRGLSCLVAFELKTTSFKPEYIGKMNFYLEALDRDHKKQNENPSVGVILCADKDDEVVEYALQRNLSPVLVAEYTAKLPDKKLLQNKLRELTDLAM
ncbi:MAG: PDDEXK nuclease domain-containing protein [Bacteroidales bacterium]|jgi:predicted nuclease of restriction endonuclease-like (RecB) superfamily|nr:PDDEXK nuclease domain-containing protein [Bacteroidales bacterium]